MRHQRVADQMTTDVVTIGANAGFKEIVTQMAGHGVTALPVVDGTGHVLGMVTETDLLRKIEFSEDQDIVPLFERHSRREARHKAEAVRAAGLMTTPPVTISRYAPLVRAARELSTQGLRRLIVTDEFGALAGIISRGDLLGVYDRPDDDIAAEVRDHILRRAMAIPPESFRVRVTDGVVDVAGRLERRSQIPLLIGLTRAVDGVVDVRPDLTYENDDTIPLQFTGP